MGTKSAGEIVEVPGGYIVRSMGRKDRHSKVYTSKGARDRRVRLSAHTAIQFYDVQDRLGYDRPSKAVDWLINKAKTAIDKLDVPPPWHPITQPEPNNSNEAADGSANIFRLRDDPSTQEVANFLPTSSNASSINFQNFPSDVISRNAIHSQDLGLSLHSFQDPGLIGQSHGNTRPIFGSGSVLSMGFEADFHRMVAWNHETSTENNSGVGGRGGGGFVFNSLSSTQQTEIGQIAQRGTLQSSFSQSVHAWNDVPNANSSVFGSRFAPDGLLGFCIPSQVRGEDDHSVVLDRPFLSSPNSHH